MGLIQNKVTVSQPNSHVIVKNAGGLRGLTGPQGIPGPQGEPGEAATVTAGTTTTLPAGSDATVQNVGSTSDAIFNFGIPQGEKGETGETGAAATIEVGSTTTLPTGQDATVTNSGTSSAAVFDFGIPRGPQGEEGPQGFSPSASVSKTGDTATITITDKDGTTTAQITDGVTPTVDDALSPTSENPVQNKVVTNALSGKQPSFEIVDELPAEGVEGSEYLVDKAYETITELQGDTQQTTISGAQLLAKQGMSTPLSDSDYWSSIGNLSQFRMENGWGRFTPTTSTGTHNFFTKYAAFQWEVNTTYTVIVELKNVPSSGSGSVTLTQPQNATDPFDSTSEGGQVSYTFAGVDHTVVFSGVTKSAVTSNGLRCYFSSGFTTDKTVDIRITIVKGDHLADWQNYAGDNWKPYVGGIDSPNPDYPQEVQTVTGRQVVTISDGGSQSQEYEINLGKNLINTSVGYENKYINASGVEVTDDSQKNALFNGYIAVQPNTAYTMTNIITGGIRMNFAFYNGNTLISRSVQDSGVNTRTITTPEGCNALRVWVYKDTAWTQTDIDDANLQLERGSATTYAPYFTPIELCKIGTYQDYIYKSGEDWYVHKEVGIVTLDSTMSWDKSSGITIVNRYRTQVVTDNAYGYSTALAMSTHNIGISQRASDGGALGVSTRGTGGGLFFATPLGIADTLSDFNTWVDANKPNVYYALATPTDTQITNADLIAQLEAINAVAIKHYNTLAVSSPNLPASLVLVQGANSHLEPYVYYNGKFEKVQIV